MLDFIGQANKRYNFEDKFAALLSNTTPQRDPGDQRRVCLRAQRLLYQLEKKAAKYILDNIRASYGNTAGLVSRAASFAEDSGLELTLANFLDYYHLDPRAIYKFSSFSRICARADVLQILANRWRRCSQKPFGRIGRCGLPALDPLLLDLLPRLDRCGLCDAE